MHHLELAKPCVRHEGRHVLQALSVNLRRQTLDGAARNIGKLRTAIENVKRTDTQRLQNEYRRLLTGLRQQGALPPGTQEDGAAGGDPLPLSSDWLANPQVPHDILQEAVSLLLLLLEKASFTVSVISPCTRMPGKVLWILPKRLMWEGACVLAHESRSTRPLAAALELGMCLCHRTWISAHAVE